jgi:dTDP-N-acetylfucosamine:lipid II N-acetylfucosaminyltransferase
MDARILHLIPDDKFLDGAIIQFESCCPGIHDYVMYNRREPSEVVYVRTLDKVRFAPEGSLLCQELITECLNGRYSAVIFHSIPSYFAEFVAKVKGSVKLIVVTWGHDIYTFINKKEYMRETLKIKYSRRVMGNLFFLKRIWHSLSAMIRFNSWIPPDSALKAFLSVDYICPVIDTDYELFAHKFRRFKLPEMMSFSYMNHREQLLLENSEINDNYVMVGNSATPECNHADVLSHLKNIGVSNRILLPLNYGYSREYGNIIRERGKKMFGEQCLSLDTFMSMNDYLMQLKRCRFAVMGHRRQQAVGNIAMLMWMGAKIFFAEGNPVYEYLSAQGAVVFIFDKACRMDFESPLNDIEVTTNRKIVEKIWGREQVLKKTQNVINKALSS